MKHIPQFTQGNWRYEKAEASGSPTVKVRTEHGNLTIAVVSTEALRQASTILNKSLPIGFTKEKDEYNAKLMAQAPNLLETVKECYDFIKQGANTKSIAEKHDLLERIEVLYEFATDVRL